MRLDKIRRIAGMEIIIIGRENKTFNDYVAK
jgi:hypothetical protein